MKELKESLGELILAGIVFNDILLIAIYLLCEHNGIELPVQFYGVSFIALVVSFLVAIVSANVVEDEEYYDYYEDDYYEE